MVELLLFNNVLRKMNSNLLNRRHDGYLLAMIFQSSGVLEY